MKRPLYPLKIQKALDELIKNGNEEALKVKKANEEWVSLYRRIRDLDKRATSLQIRTRNHRSKLHKLSTTRERKRWRKKLLELQQEYLEIERQKQMLKQELQHLSQKYNAKELKEWKNSVI
jgi:predicted  nucleic acid-binding Zn-ribbon protein